jgi:hypothetical protein
MACSRAHLIRVMQAKLVGWTPEQDFEQGDWSGQFLLPS